MTASEEAAQSSLSTRVLFFGIKCVVSVAHSTRRLMFPGKIAPSLNIPDLHPKVTYCFSEGSAVSHHLASNHGVPSKSFQETV